MKKLLFLFAVLLMTQFISAQIIHVPGDHTTIQAAIDASNVMLIDPEKKKRTRIGYIKEKGKKIRVAKRSGSKLTKK